MQTRTFGGRDTGAIGLGCMSFAGFYGPTDEATSHACLARALERGVTHWDTAEVYGMGRSEEILGRFFATHGGRDKVHLATKGGIYPKPKRHFRNDAEALRGSLTGSLKRLGVDHVDLYYIHRRQQDMPIEEVVGILGTFQDEGLIGGFGFSEIAPHSLRRAHAERPVTAVQSEYSIWSRQPDLGMIQACAALGVTFVPFSPLARGMMSAQAPDPASFGDTDFRKNNPRFVAPNFAANCAQLDAFRAWCGDKGWTMPATALAWVLAQGPHLVPIPGTRTAAHLDDFADGAEIALTASDLAEIESLLPPGFAHGARYSDAQFVGIEQYG